MKKFNEFVNESHISTYPDIFWKAKRIYRKKGLAFFNWTIFNEATKNINYGLKLTIEDASGPLLFQTEKECNSLQEAIDDFVTHPKVIELNKKYNIEL